MGYLGNQITTTFPSSISVDDATISGNTTIGGTLGVTGVSTLSDNVVFDASSKGVHLGVTSATASNLLDDYEEGTFTPVLSFGGGTTGITYSSQQGIYTKVGRKVTVTINIALTSKGTSTGNVSISMPFSADSIGYEQGHHQPYMPSVTVDGRATHYINSGSTATNLVDQADSGTAGFLNETNFVNTSIIRSTIIYFSS